MLLLCLISTKIVVNYLLLLFMGYFIHFYAYRLFFFYETKIILSQLKLRTVFVSATEHGGYTNVLKIDLKCPEKYIKAYIFFNMKQALPGKLANLITN
jgi:hypothetical protein